MLLCALPGVVAENGSAAVLRGSVHSQSGLHAVVPASADILITVIRSTNVTAVVRWPEPILQDFTECCPGWWYLIEVYACRYPNVVPGEPDWHRVRNLFVLTDLILMVEPEK